MQAVLPNHSEYCSQTSKANNSSVSLPILPLKNGIIIPKLARVRYRGARTMPRNAGLYHIFAVDTHA